MIKKLRKKWHVDHIIPLSSATNEKKELKELFKYKKIFTTNAVFVCVN